MALLTVKLRTVSPLFLGGANPRGQPELRSASVRGQLRYWLRAMLGTRLSDPNKVWDYESDVFGSTDAGSALSIRLHHGSLSTASYPLMPHKHDRPASQEAISPEQNFELELATRPGIPIPAYGFVALELWLLLGGLGKRSRRMFGALQPDGHLWAEATPRNPDELMSLIANTMSKFGKNPKKLLKVHKKTPAFPTLNPAHSRIVVGTLGYDSAIDANVDLFHNLLRTAKYRQDEHMFGYARGGRRASPLIAQVRRIGDKLYPVLTVMRSPIKSPNWNIINDFMDDAEKVFNGTTIWGGKL